MKSDMQNIKEIYLAGGCFWGTEHFISKIEGVVKTSVGYANGITKNPTYKDVCTGTTGHAETVYVAYNKTKISLKLILDLYYETINPTSIDKQGNDFGSQYRTGIYYEDLEDLEIIKDSISILANNFEEKIVIEVTPLLAYYESEEYHQKYLLKNPTGYCHISNELFDKASNFTSPNSYTKMDDDKLKETLTEEQYNVTQNSFTERAYSNKYWDNYDKGIYVDITSGQPLFTFADKYHCSCGWPSFSKPISNDIIVEYRDNTLGVERVEVKSKLSDSHLGHVFDDGPKELGGLRYCINSASLRFVSIDDMEDQGYSYLISMVE